MDDDSSDSEIYEKSPLPMSPKRQSGEDARSENQPPSSRTTEGYLYVLRDPEKKMGEFMLGRSRNPVEDLTRVNAPWTPEMQRYHPLNLVYMARALDMTAAQIAAKQSLIDDLSMVLKHGPTASGDLWLQNPQSRTIEQLSACVRRAVDQWHASKAELYSGLVEVDGDKVRVEWKVREPKRQLSIIQRLAGEDTWC
eukprot:scpid77642/ scgid20719/ 